MLQNKCRLSSSGLCYKLCGTALQLETCCFIPCDANQLKINQTAVSIAVPFQYSKKHLNNYCRSPNNIIVALLGLKSMSKLPPKTIVLSNEAIDPLNQGQVPLLMSTIKCT
uniref:Uncharacterized protein n=1 Tax=Romanomermis culicivorax TaxID=13658 RepID=A0A915K9S2_ROMCU